MKTGLTNIAIGMYGETGESDSTGRWWFMNKYVVSNPRMIRVTE
jgi:hypothetical protein